MPKTTTKNANGLLYDYDGIRIVEVVWVDAEEIGEVGWNDLSDMLRASVKPCPVMTTVGYVAYESDEHISLLSTLGPNQSSRLDKIPKAWVRRETTIREGTSLVNRGKKPKRERQSRKGTSE